MKNTFKWMLAAILAFCGMTMILSSCGKKNDVKDLNGLYYNDRYIAGSIEGLGEYTRVLQAVQLNGNGTGTWWKFFFSPHIAAKPLFLDGGTIAVDGTFSYTVSDDGVVTATRNGDFISSVDHPKTLVFQYDNGTLIDKDNLVLTKSPEGYTSTLDRLEQLMLGASNDGELNGLFSVGNGKKVYFSKGNLQWSGTHGWRFAERQYDCLGNQANNNNPTASDGNYMEFFCWGATGLNGVNPNTTSSYLYGEVDLSGNNDWGANAITNGGNTPGSWRVLTYDEWQYLLEDKTKYGHATVAGMAGIILLPDDFVDPMTNHDDSLAFKTADVMGFDAAYDNNIYSAGEGWSMMETAGAVFLPSAGCRYESNVSMVGRVGQYWTATHDDDEESYIYNISSSYVNSRSLHRTSALSVRLVRDAN